MNLHSYSLADLTAAQKILRKKSKTDVTVLPDLNRINNVIELKVENMCVL